MYKISYLAIVTALALIFSATTHAAELNHSKLSRGTKANDRDIEKHIRVVLKQTDPQFTAPNIRVVSFNQVVLLIGRVDGVQTRSKVLALTGQTPLVRKVHNELQVAGSISGLARTSDRITKFRVKRAIGKLDIEADYRVEVEHGHVYLMGLVTPMQGDQMTDAARKSKGVTLVTAVFEYL